MKEEPGRRMRGPNQLNLDRLPELVMGLEVVFDHELGPSHKRLMDTLGVKVVVREPVRRSPDKQQRKE